MAERDLVVRFIGDDRSLNQAFTRSTRNAKQFEKRTMTVGSALTRTFAGLGITLGTIGAFKGVEKAVGAASDLNEQVSKSRQVFGDSSKAIEEWSQTTAVSLGISQREALSAAGTFGNLFRVIDLAPDKAGEMSRALVQLAADLASFNNASPEDVLVAIRSGLIGEAEPLRRYGVLLSEARVQQQALADTGKTNAKTLTDQEKALARYQIILQDTASAQGDFERTQDGLANQTRILRANLDDLTTQLGKKFLPATNAALSRFNDLIGAIQKKPPKLDFADVITNLSALRRARDEMAAFAGEGDIRTQALTRALNDLETKAVDVSKAYRAHLSPALRQTATDADGYTHSVADAADRSRDLATVSGILATKLADAGSRMQAAAGDANDLANAQARAAMSAEKRFTTSIKGLQLKLEKAELTPSLQNDLAVLNEILARINRRIRAEGRTFELEQERVRVLKQIQSVEGQIADEKASSAANAKAAAAADRESAQAAKEAARAAAARAAVERRARAESLQFRKLGLTSEGQPRGPSVRNLRHRVGSLRDQIEGTVLDTKKTDAQLDRISLVLSGKFGKVGRDVRLAILEMLNDIASALTSGSKKAGTALTRGTGEITRGGIRSTEKLIKGLGLTKAQEDAIRRRNRGITRRGGLSAFGFAVGGERRRSVGPTIDLRPSSAEHGRGQIVINGPITVVSDDPDDFMRKLQKKSSRTSGSRRGRHGGVRLGLG
jgi:hypothetical protein